ncbi:hypothetical protein M0654_12505 [Rhizobium sp. NTR19]|uniref:Uncharacterized protein n=1 Tax=Neorhizobium turbinariae TaxID=2937795 RepID=A0ABT0ISH3_9HYPH|nr:hypothetical protein [Neorhizobium turbinariae]MCK8780806.1 hypothetical protein [Neorhizobium turbinariae]
MHPYVRTRAAEIDEKLGPVLKEMGLRKRVFTHPYEYEFFFSKPRRKDLVKPFSPVSIFFWRDPDLREAEWHAATVKIGHWSARAVGDSGWTRFGKWDETEEEGLHHRDDLFGWLEGEIRARGLVELRPERPGEVATEELEETYLRLQSIVPDIAIVWVETEYGRYEAVTFQDPEGRRIHICFAPYRFTPVLVDGQKIGTCSGPERAAVIAEVLSKGSGDFGTSFSVKL